jgi:hypothetical protein
MSIGMRRRVGVLALALGIVGPAPRAPAAFVLAGADGAAPVFVAPGEPECVRLAAEDLVRDVARITGRTPALAKSADDAGVVLASANRPESAALLDRLAPGFAGGLAGKWEAYRVEIVGARLVVAGSDERGTMFGLYAFIEEHLGVDPLHFWTSRAPRPRAKLEWGRVRIVSDGPTFRFRGWFINDEDLLTEWKESGGARRIDYPYYAQVVNREVIRAVAEALVRSRFNLIIPASFVDILNPPEAALLEECARRGVFLSQHHVEPMGVSAFAYFNYWKDRGRDLKYSYYSHPAEVREVWRVYAEKWAALPNVIWQLGLRGIADRPMWMADPATPQSDAERGRLISDAMAEQVRILDEVLPGRPRIMSTTLWAEGSALNRQGLLTIPTNTIVVFADNSPGWKWQEDFHSTPRDPRNTYGVYYHHGLIGSGPHLAQVPSPRKTHECLRTAVEKGAGTYAIFNVGNIREFVLGIDATAKMTWRMDGFDPDAWLDGWARERFPSRAAEAATAYRSYFDAWQIHPEQGVPFLMDGQMFGAGNSALGKLAKRLKETTPKPPAAATNAHAAKTGDAFWSGLSDMHPRALGRDETLRHLAAQRDGLSKAIKIASAAASGLPNDEAAFLRDNLIHQAAIMVRTGLWLEQVETAGDNLDRGDRAGCAAALASAEAAFAEIPRISESYCRGPWENWYRGCRKLNIEATLKRTRDVLAQAQNAEPRSRP